MRIHCLQHMPFEDPGNIAPWAAARGHSLARTLLYQQEPLPGPDDFDWLVVLGGVMNVYQTDLYPWLVGEKALLSRTLDAGKHVLGICLGAQLIADVLGAPVRRHSHREIGWFPVTLTDAGLRSPLFAGFPPTFKPFHWHGDTFDLPPGCIHLGQSEACAQQAFQFGPRVLGLQFHLDYTAEGIELMLANCGDEMVPGPCVQTADLIRADVAARQEIGRLLFLMLDALAAA